MSDIGCSPGTPCLLFKASGVKTAMWFSLGNACEDKSLCTRGLYTHTQGPKKTCCIPHRLQAVGEGGGGGAIYGCFRGLTNTPSASFLSPSLESLPSPWLVLPFFLFVPHPLLSRTLSPSTEGLIQAPASETLPACFVC